MSGPLSAPTSVVYEAESPPRNKKRRLSPIQESPQSFRRVTRSVSRQSSVDTIMSSNIKVKKDDSNRSSEQFQAKSVVASKAGGEELVSSFYLKFAANLR